MLTNFDCDCFWVRDREALVAALTILPEYLRNAAIGVRRGDRLPRLAGPAGPAVPGAQALVRAALLRGRAAAELVRGHVAAAQWLAGRVRRSTQFELAASVPLNLVCLRHVDGDAATQQVLDTVNGSGRAYLTHTRVADRLVIRVSVAQRATGLTHVQRLWDELGAAAPPAGSATRRTRPTMSTVGSDRATDQETDRRRPSARRRRG